MKRRLQRLSVDARELIDLNNKLMDAGRIVVGFDPMSDTLTFGAGEGEIKLQLRRAKPDVPIRMNRLTEGAAYDAAQDRSDSAELVRLRPELETRLEAYYNSAHRVLKLLSSIPGLKKCSCIQITLVRNKLIEHPPPGSIYSFGYGATGPRVKPLRRGGSEWNDEGLVPNTRAFIQAIQDAITQKLGLAT